MPFGDDLQTIEHIVKREYMYYQNILSTYITEDTNTAMPSTYLNDS